MPQMLKLPNFLMTMVIGIASLGMTLTAEADTMDARCDVYPRGEERAASSGLCTFSQQQGAIGSQLQDGRRYDLRSVGDQPGTYVDQDDQSAYREAGLDDRGQIYRLATESIYVYWDSAPDNSQNSQLVPQ